MLNPLEVVGIFGKPPLLAFCLARLLTLGQVTKLLPVAVTVIGGKKIMAVLTMLLFDKRHDLQPPGQSFNNKDNMGRK